MSNPRFSVGETIIYVRDGSHNYGSRHIVEEAIHVENHEFLYDLGQSIVYTGFVYKTDLSRPIVSELGFVVGLERHFRPIPKEKSVSWVYFAATVGWSPYEDLTGSFPVKEVV